MTRTMFCHQIGGPITGLAYKRNFFGIFGSTRPEKEVYKVYVRYQNNIMDTFFFYGNTGTHLLTYRMTGTN